MKLVTLDFETFYGDDYTLSKLTTEAYVRDPRFETILCGFKVDGGPSYWLPAPAVEDELHRLELDQCGVVMHHAHFDALILSHHYGIKPKAIFDTLSLARALHGANGRLSLDKLAERYGIGKKGHEVVLAKGKRLADFNASELMRYGAYCANDVDLCHELFTRMAPRFTRYELQIVDAVIRMFTEPVLVLDTPMLREYADELRSEKSTLLLQAGVQIEDVMSNDRFADMLERLGVEPPRKVSPTWLKKAPGERPEEAPLTWAFAKSDPQMQALQEHPDERVQIVVEARLKNKTTIAEKGAERLIGMGSRGPATIYLKYSGASGTHRLSAGDKINWQAFKRGSKLRRAVMAPIGHMCVVGDSSNIEARLLDWLAGQENMVQAYRDYDAGIGPDIYCVMAEAIYKRKIVKKEHPDERQQGKIAKLGLGFGMGHVAYRRSVRAQAKGPDGKPLDIGEAFAMFVVTTYRESHAHVVKLWRRCDHVLTVIARGELGVAVDPRGIVRTCEGGLVLPGGLRILYPELKKERNEETGFDEWTFWNGKTRETIHGRKVTENIIQALARLVVFKQCYDTLRECRTEGRWVHSVHDEGIYVAHAYDAPYVAKVLLRNLRTPPEWAPDLPLNGEVGFHRRYGDAKA